jgi:hypothetical protein
VDVVLFSKLDRLSRSVMDFHNFAQEAAEHGADLVSVAESLDLTSPSQRFVATILAAFAEMEAATISERLVRGGRCGGCASVAGWSGTLGYQAAPHPAGRGRGLVVNGEEAALVRRLADHVLDGNSAYSAVAVARASGIKPRRADAWSLASIIAILTGDSALGRLRHRSALVRDETGLPVTPWEPILPLGDVERLRALLAPSGQGRGTHTRRKAARLLSGLVRCATCEGRMRVSTNLVNGRLVGRYACRGESEGRGCTSPTSITAEPLEQYIEQEYLRCMAASPSATPSQWFARWPTSPQLRRRSPT